MVEWNKWGRVGRLDITITIITTISLFDSILLTMVVLFCSPLYFLVAFLYWMAYCGLVGLSGMGEVECDGWGRVWWVG